MSKNEPLIMVCVTQQLSCERLINFGAKLAEHRAGRLLVVSVKPPEDSHDIDMGETLDYLFALSKQAGAELAVLYHDSPALAIAHLAKMRDVDFVVTGVAPDNEFSGFHKQLTSSLLHASLLVIDGSGNPVRARDSEKGNVFKPLAISI